MEHSPPSGSINLKPLGIIRSCYQQKFSIPRQPGLAPDAPAIITISAGKEDQPQQLLEGIESFSHLWILFYFHNLKNSPEARNKVRPPRLGGEKSTGSLACRSPYRPNPIGLSVVKLEKCLHTQGTSSLLVTGGDFLDGTPILDIKPYLPYCDSVPEAKTSWANRPEQSLQRVSFSDKARNTLKRLGGSAWDFMLKSISQSLLTDPRPSWRQRKFPGDDERTYHTAMFGLDLHWQLQQFTVLVTEISLLDKDCLSLFNSFWSGKETK